VFYETKGRVKRHVVIVEKDWKKPWSESLTSGKKRGQNRAPGLPLGGGPKKRGGIKEAGRKGDALISLTTKNYLGD